MYTMENNPFPQLTIGNLDSKGFITFPSSLPPSLSVYEPYCLNVVLSVLGLSSGKQSSQISAAVTSYFTAVYRSGSTELILRSLFGKLLNNYYAL